MGITLKGEPMKFKAAKWMVWAGLSLASATGFMWGVAVADQNNKTAEKNLSEPHLGLDIYNSRDKVELQGRLKATSLSSSSGKGCATCHHPGNSSSLNNNKE
jgi:hypothetical protein